MASWQSPTEWITVHGNGILCKDQPSGLRSTAMAYWQRPTEWITVHGNGILAKTNRVDYGPRQWHTGKDQPSGLRSPAMAYWQRPTEWASPTAMAYCNISLTFPIHFLSYLL